MWKLKEWSQVLVIAWLVIFSAAAATAHEDTLIQIERLTLELETSTDPAPLLFQRGRHYFEHANYSSAIQDYTDALTADPTRLEPLIFRGLAQHRFGLSKEGLNDVNRFVESATPYYLAFAVRSEIRAGLGDLKGAVADLSEANKLRPLPEQYVMQSRLALELGDDAGAMAALEEGIKTLHSPVALVLGLVDLAAELGFYDKALAQIDTLDATGIGKERWRILRGDVLERAGRSAEAHDAYEEALTLLEARFAKGRVTQYALIDKGKALAGLGRIDDALKVLHSLDPTVHGLREYAELSARLIQKPAGDHETNGNTAALTHNIHVPTEGESAP